MDKWEYAMITTNNLHKKHSLTELHTKMTDMGSRGWELVSQVPIQGSASYMFSGGGGGTNAIISTFKRKIPQ